MAHKSSTASSSPSSRSRHSKRTQQVSLFRRLFGLLFSPFVIAPLIVLSLVGAGVLYYYYQRYTALIDAGLRGDIFVRSSGIYAAPLELRVGGGLKASDLVAHLRRVGYLERSATKNEKRGQYAVRGNTVEITPGADAVIDGEPAFQKLKVTFAPSGGVQSITNLSSREQVSRAEVEPELISSVINQEREKRKIIEYKDLPQSLVDAITTIEDRQFFEHPGVNWRAIVRALVRNYQAGETREGGSTITQQLVKNFFLKPEKTLKRKLAEAYISILLEHRLTKEQIITMYCNQIYLGQRGGFSINGFGEAARSYFDKDISQLTLAESAMLAGIIRSPNHYAPFKHPDRAKDRRNFVLEAMVEAGKIDREEAERAKAAPLGVKGVSGRLNTSDAPYFVDYLTKYVESHFDENTDALKSLRIYSTLDSGLQQAAYQAVTKHMAAIEKMLAKRKGGTAGLQAALVALNAKTGEVLAMIGGRDYATSQLNRATDAKRQPGSVFKPFVYAAALQTAEGYGSTDIITPATMFLDAPRTFNSGGKEYNPGNFGDTYTNKYMTLRDALVNSKNVITVELAERVGLSNVASLAARAGLPRPPTYPSMALGVAEATPLQIASAYTMFANAGRRAAPTPLRRITTGTGATVFTPTKDSREVISPQVAYVMTSIMQDVINRGTGARVRQMGFTGKAAGKTGSSRDGWFAGYTPNLVCVVWVGFDDNSDLKLTGGVTAAPIWAEFMMKALQLRPDLGGDFTDPGDITTIEIDPTTGMVAQAGTPNARPELFIKGTEPNHEAPQQPDQSRPESEPPPETTEPPEAQPPRPGRSGAAYISTRQDNLLSETVVLEVCADTGLFPTANVCRHTVRRRFALGQEPHDFCSAKQHQRLVR